MKTQDAGHALAVATRITRARTALLLDSPWFGARALRLEPVEDTTGATTATMSTDGTRLLYSPEWIAQRTDAEIVAVIAHEVLHCGLLHMYRRNGRDLAKWNAACDYAINPLLARQGFRLPPPWLEAPQYASMSAEQIYAVLPDKPPAGDRPDFRDPTPGGSPETDVSGVPPASMSAVDWQIAAEQATMVANRAGKMDGATALAVHDTHVSDTDWRAVLRQFVEHTVPTDYSWTRPNRRYLARGLYLPGVICANTPRLGIAIDTSGSIDQHMLNRFAAELTAILYETRPAALDVVYCTTHVQHTETFDPDGPAVLLHARGGGGTAFQPALDWFSQADTPPAAVIYLTDLQGPTPNEPEYPVLWAVPESCRMRPAFGERGTLTWEPA